MFYCEGKIKNNFSYNVKKCYQKSSITFYLNNNKIMMHGNHIYNIKHFKSQLKVNLLNFKKYMSFNTLFRIFPHDW